MKKSHLKPLRPLHSALSKLLRMIAGWFAHIDVEGLENIPARGGAVLVANHRSLFDAPALASALDASGRDVMVLAKAELFSNKLAGRVLSKAGVIPVFRGTDRAADSLAQAVKSLQGAEIVAVFPEGTIPKDGQLLPFKSGATRMALEAQLPVIPIVLIGTDNVIASNVVKVKRTLLRRTVAHADITVVIGAPIDIRGYTVEAGTAAIRDTMVQMLAVHDRPKNVAMTKRGLVLTVLGSIPVLGSIGRVIYKAARK